MTSSATVRRGPARPEAKHLASANALAAAERSPGKSDTALARFPPPLADRPRQYPGSATVPAPPDGSA